MGQWDPWVEPWGRSLSGQTRKGKGAVWGNGKVSEVAQSSPTLCHPMDYSLPGSSIHGIFQARILEWVSISFSRRSSWPRDWIQVSHIVGRHFTMWATREVYCPGKLRHQTCLNLLFEKNVGKETTYITLQFVSRIIINNIISLFYWIFTMCQAPVCPQF